MSNITNANLEIINNIVNEVIEESTPKKKGRPRKNSTLPKIDTDIIDLNHLSVKDIRNNPISKEEIRNAVETYYDMQNIRIASGNRKFSVENGSDSGATPLYLQYIENRFKDTEETIAKFLKIYAENDPVGRWLLSIPGIGGVLASALIAYIDIEKCQTAGAIWAYAGWEGPMQYRKKGEKINYNPKFRVICWKIGQSFIKVSGNDKDIYGKLYKAKREFYTQKNDAGGFAEKAAYELSVKKYNQNTKAYQAYSQGKLPDAHIVSMASRFAVKMFLSHLFTVWYEYHNGKPAPAPFVEAHLGHVHIIQPPNREILLG